MNVKLYLEERGYIPILIGYLGSHHLGLKDDKSDIDYFAYVLPTFNDLVLNKQANCTFKVNDTISITINTLPSLLQNIHKIPFNLFEVVSHPIYIKPNFHDCYDAIISLLKEEQSQGRTRSNFYFVGRKYYKAMFNEDAKGSNPQHIKDGVNYKAVAKANFYHELLTQYDRLFELFQENPPDLDITQRYHHIRTNQTFNDYDKLDNFYNEKDKVVQNIIQINSKPIITQLIDYLQKELLI